MANLLISIQHLGRSLDHIGEMSKNPVGVEKSLLHSITVVDVNIDVQHTGVMFQQLCAKI